MVWYGPDKCTCNCCQCAPQIGDGCYNLCDSRTTGVQSVITSLRNFPAVPTYRYGFTDPTGNINNRWFYKQTITGWDRFNIEDDLLLSRVNPIPVGYFGDTECPDNLLPNGSQNQLPPFDEFGIFQEELAKCCFKLHPRVVTLDIKYEAKKIIFDTYDLSWFNNANACDIWNDPLATSDYESKSSTVTYNRQWITASAIRYKFVANADCAGLQTSSACSSLTPDNLYLHEALNRSPVYCSDFLNVDRLTLCVEECQQKSDSTNPAQPCRNSADATETGRESQRKIKKRSDTPFVAPSGYEITLSNLPAELLVDANKLQSALINGGNNFEAYYVGELFGGQCTETGKTRGLKLTGLDAFNGKFYLDASENGCNSEVYQETATGQIAAAYCVTRQVIEVTLSPKSYEAIVPCTIADLLIEPIDIEYTLVFPPLDPFGTQSFRSTFFNPPFDEASFCDNTWYEYYNTFGRGFAFINITKFNGVELPLRNQSNFLDIPDFNYLRCKSQFVEYECPCRDYAGSNTLFTYNGASYGCQLSSQTLSIVDETLCCSCFQNPKPWFTMRVLAIF